MILTVSLFVLNATLCQSGTIAFITGESPFDYQLACLDLGSGEVRTPGRGLSDSAPQWSPDGSRVAYQSRIEGGYSVCVYSVDTETTEILPHTYAWNYEPAWSPDSRKIAYCSEVGDTPLRSLAVYDLESQREELWGGGHEGLLSPAWLPSTDMLKALDPDDQLAADSLGLFALKEEAEKNGALLAIGVAGMPPKLSTEIFIVTRDQVIPLLSLLTGQSTRYVRYAVTPDFKGRQIAYECNEGGDREIFMIGRRGIANLSNHPAADWNPKWSPDNNWITFESFRNGYSGIYLIQATTAGVTAIAGAKEYQCWSPSWSPDGKWIVYVSNESGMPQLYASSFDGITQKQLTHEKYGALNPVWRPAPQKSKD
ncbi:MAG TPA: hypothetical protein PLQ42_04415 [Candidatus Hydrogenedentes bacterium]|jgi:Tol biopolymer transport system component|nr:MAG: translocation protein TolB [Candidatus Hydrogenedentes bacterium ADurb.Bin170]HNZ47776.1 hypothetical protein [Candidatus Hydrogenedentota bacterium]HOD94772.1 hypothetical protein [Candidatus Hydrogenedentota bacterium]HOR50306.1 hypothetical protein [Candidatus Hydrogenedentota bacterium]HPK24205.1 hypothetical protein [Candidatus Hydrogenedentota bacterium]